MKNKNCQECGKDYESTSVTGQEQKYCSKSCRNKAANKRRENNILEKLKGQIQPTTISGNEKPEIERTFVGNYQSNYSKNFELPAERIFELVTTNANITAENKRLEEKIKNVEENLRQLEFEYDELESKFEEQQNNGSMISGINNLVDKVSPMVPLFYQMFSKPKNANNAQTKTA
jgi:flagellar biosynthesis chaperone FliJ